MKKELDQKKIGFQDIHLELLASDSYGVRSMACGVETPDCRILIDPGCSLGPHGNLKIPHPQEWIQNKRMTEKLLEYAKTAQYLFISHFHRDHYKPPEPDYFYLYTDHEIAAALYAGKTIFHKSMADLGHYQRTRLQSLIKCWEPIVKEHIEIQPNPIIQDKQTVFIHEQRIGNTHLLFPLPISHAEVGTKMGRVQPIIVKHQNEAVFFWGDVHGFANRQPNDPLSLIKKAQHMAWFQEIEQKVLIFDGPPESQFLRPPIQQWLADYYSSLLTQFNTLICDHHPYRSKNIDQWLQLEHKIQTLKERPEGQIFNYFDLAAAQPLGLNERRSAVCEANRIELYHDSPPSQEYLQWGQNCLRGLTEIRPPIA